MNIADLENKIINADCMDILKELPDKSVDLVLTDPPYDLETHGGTKSPLAQRAAKVRDSIEFIANDFDFWKYRIVLYNFTNSAHIESRRNADSFASSIRCVRDCS